MDKESIQRMVQEVPRWNRQLGRNGVSGTHKAFFPRSMFPVGLEEARIRKIFDELLSEHPLNLSFRKEDTTFQAKETELKQMRVRGEQDGWDDKKLSEHHRQLRRTGADKTVWLWKTSKHLYSYYMPCTIDRLGLEAEYRVDTTMVPTFLPKDIDTQHRYLESTVERCGQASNPEDVLDKM